MLDDAIGVGAEQCFLEVRESNHAAIALYLREGFAPVARRAGYYPAPARASGREDALVMRRRLVGDPRG
jgi:ribosomal-protein-alanine N-acetyltransferase